MGKAVSKLTRPLRNFNVENRAAKVLAKNEQVASPAPKHETTAKQLSKFRQEHPEYLEAVSSKSDVLHERLKQIYVDTKDPPIEIKSATTSKPPPLSRATRPETDLGVMDVDYEIPEGKAQLKTILTFLGQHQLNPEEVSVQSIAENYKLDLNDVESMVHHFKVLQIYIPEAMYKENKSLKKIMAKQMSEGVAMQAVLKLPEDKQPSKQIGSGEELAPSKPS